MKNCDADVRGYHADRVVLSPAKSKELRDRRDANRRRLERGLEAAEEPQPERFAAQGSCANKTVIQEPKNSYDIDDGAVFERGALKGDRGADRTALDARTMVRDALDDGSFNTAPETKPNCVRVHYDDGPHVDIPVYRRTPGEAGKKDVLELAAADWKSSNPDAALAWFDGRVEARDEAGQLQFRQDIRLLKSLCANRPSYYLPNGITLTVLVDEKFTAADERLDRSFRQLITDVYARLQFDLRVRHPVEDEYLTNGDKDQSMIDLRSLLATAIEDLKVLDLPNCSRSKALKAWKKVFNTDYFDGRITEAEDAEKAETHAAVISAPTSPKPWCR